MMLRTVLVAVLLGAAATAQAPGQDPGPAAPPPPKKLTEWPELTQSDKDKVLALAGQFRKADPKLHEPARLQLLALGAGAAPLLMQQVADRAENVNPQLFLVFDTMLGPQHGALLAREVKKPRQELRRYLAQRLCRFTDPELLPVLQELRKDKDERTAFLGALGCLALGDTTALAPVMAWTKTRWSEDGTLVAEVLPHARSAEAGNELFAAIAKASTPDQMAGLRLARYLAVKDHGVVLRTYLQSTDHVVKKEAVNAARVLHGEPPLENLSVFQATKFASEWLQKL